MARNELTDEELQKKQLEKTKGRYWQAVLYPENLIENWEEEIYQLLEYPFAYCVHDKDVIKGTTEKRKTHIHVILAFPNTTTYRHVMALFKRLDKPKCTATNTCQTVSNVKGAYDYLIHDTTQAKKDGKYQYPKSERIEGNNFDIGNYIQLGAVDKLNMSREICDFIVQNEITNFADLYMAVVTNFDSTYFEVLQTYSGFYERLIKGSYHKKFGKE